MTAENIWIDQERGGDHSPDLYRTSRLDTSATAMDAVGAAEIASYHEHGYLAVHDALSSSSVDSALAGLTSLVTDPGGADIVLEAWAADKLDQLDGPARLDAVRKFMYFIDQEERLAAIARDERLLRLVRRLAGSEDVTLFQDMALLKPPGAGREKPWHQDNAFFTFEPGTPIVGVWIALDEATVDNGCMHVLPGTHREGPVVHFRRRDWQICDTDVQTSRTVAVPLPPGGALFFHALLHHGTPVNRSDRHRRALQFHDVPTSAVAGTEDRRLEIFGSEGKNVTC